MKISSQFVLRILLRIFITALVLFPLFGCGAMLCTKGDTKQGLFFDFDSAWGKSYVDIGSEPTAVSGSSWVKNLIVDHDGFLLVTSQKSVHCDNVEEMNRLAKQGKSIGCKGHRLVERYLIRRYVDERGYEEWGYDKILKKEWQGIDSLRYSFSKKPDYHYENCRWHFLGGLYKLFQVMDRI